MTDPATKKKTKLPAIDATAQPSKTKAPQPVMLPKVLYLRFQISPGESIDAAIRATAPLDWVVHQLPFTELDGVRHWRSGAGYYEASGTIAKDEIVQVPIPLSELTGPNPTYVSIAWDVSDPKKPIYSDYQVRFAGFDDAKHPLYRLVSLGYVMPFRDDRATTKAFTTASVPPEKKAAPALRGESPIEEQAILQFQADHGLTFNGALGLKGWAAVKKATGG